MKKVLALDPTVREQDCDYFYVYYTGAILCTGLLRCSLCGARVDQHKEK